jgi:hypothetical protein
VWASVPPPLPQLQDPGESERDSVVPAGLRGETGQSRARRRLAGSNPARTSPNAVGASFRKAHFPRTTPSFRVPEQPIRRRLWPIWPSESVGSCSEIESLVSRYGRESPGWLTRNVFHGYQTDRRLERLLIFSRRRPASSVRTMCSPKKRGPYDHYFPSLRSLP